MDGSNTSLDMQIKNLLDEIKRQIIGKPCWQVRNIVKEFCQDSPIRIVHSGYIRDGMITVELAVRSTGRPLPFITVEANQSDDGW